MVSVSHPAKRDNGYPKKVYRGTAPPRIRCSPMQATTSQTPAEHLNSFWGPFICSVAFLRTPNIYKYGGTRNRQRLASTSVGSSQGYCSAPRNTTPMRSLVGDPGYPTFGLPKVHISTIIPHSAAACGWFNGPYTIPRAETS